MNVRRFGFEFAPTVPQLGRGAAALLGAGVDIATFSAVLEKKGFRCSFVGDFSDTDREFKPAVETRSYREYNVQTKIQKPRSKQKVNYCTYWYGYNMLISWPNPKTRRNSAFCKISGFLGTQFHH